MSDANASSPETFNVEIVDIYTSAGHDFKGRHGLPRENHSVERHDSVACVAGKGLVGDRYFAMDEGHKGQVTFFSAETADEAREHFGVPEFNPSAFRRNVIVRGVDLGELVGQEFTLGAVRFEGSEECRPCYWMDQALAPGAEDFLQGRGGLRARVLTSGTLNRGPAALSV
ncbi:MAG: MOSC domain-containing protein [Gemmatimonadota bacterium]